MPPVTNSWWWAPEVDDALPQSLADWPDVVVRAESVFRQIAAERMLGLPMVNPALSVAAVGFRRWQGLWAGVMLTPWSLNLMLLPAGSAQFRSGASGDIQQWVFPSGAYEFLYGEEPALGPYQMCSLFSPVFEFASQADALATAQAVTEALFEHEAQAEAGRQTQGRGTMPQPLTERPLSRRGFLRGAFGG